MTQIRHAAVLLLLTVNSVLNVHDNPRLSLEQAKKQLTDAGVHFSFGEDPFADSREGGIVLTSLTFSGRNVTDKITATCLPAFQNTTRLTFSESTAVTDDTLAVVAQLPKLQDLTILSGQITGEGLHHLSACKHLTLLKIRSNRLTHEHLEQLSKLEGLPLVNLEVGGNGCSDVGLQHIRAFPNLKWLRIQAGVDAYGKPTISGQLSLGGYCFLGGCTWITNVLASTKITPSLSIRRDSPDSRVIR